MRELFPSEGLESRRSSDSALPIKRLKLESELERSLARPPGAFPRPSSLT
jgi:hypothetical protein